MPVPKRKVSRTRRDKRFANKGIKAQAAGKCPTCSAPLASHTVCKDCGYYRGVKILRTKTERMQERGKVRQAKSKVAQEASVAREAQAADVSEQDKKD
ncbi:50S ribosomal protein L32 [bacterium]|jgi:large subunit ribosomal protein L32|nr:50S ribosomal protein L32 [bacterium]